jgi:pyruvate carboxylase
LIQRLNLFNFPKQKDRGTKMLTYIGNVTVNGFPGIGKKKKPAFDKPLDRKTDVDQPIARGTKQILDERRSRRACQMGERSKICPFTDTTFRDAHQSLLGN